MREIETTSGKKTVISVEELDPADQLRNGALVNIVVAGGYENEYIVKGATLSGIKSKIATFKVLPNGPQLDFNITDEIILSWENYPY